MRFSQGSQCTALPVSYDRKMEKQSGLFTALLTDLSKAFDCIPHDLFIVYGFQTDELNLFYDYLSTTKQRVKIN